MSSFVDVGTPPQGLRSWESAEVRFHGFEDLIAGRRQAVQSPEFTCLGQSWQIMVHVYAASGDFGICLSNKSNKRVKLRFWFCVKDPQNGGLRSANCSKVNTCSFPPRQFHGIHFARRSEVIDALDEGTLVVEVRMRLEEPVVLPPAEFVPENPSSCKLIQRLFMDETTTDIIFEVVGEEAKGNARKKAKTSLFIFHAHRFILQQCAPQLAELCGEGGGGTTSVAITDVKPDNFRNLLSYVYGKEVPEEEMRPNAKDLISAANKYGISHLKLEAEACFVKSTEIDMENVMEHLLYADAMNCALLKEAVMDFVVENNMEILQKKTLQGAPEGLLTDMLAAVARTAKKNATSAAGGSVQFGALRISDLRRQVHERGLDVDGSRETLIAALESHQETILSSSSAGDESSDEDN